MDIKHSIQKQYIATLKMLRQAIDKCPAEMWDDDKYLNQFWHIAFHALYGTHLYLQDSHESFKPWKKHREGYDLLDHIPEDGQQLIPYSKAEILEYFDFCSNLIDEVVPNIDLEADAGFEWIPFDKLELQIHSIKHIHHHTGQLYERLRTSGNISVEWVRRDADR